MPTLTESASWLINAGIDDMQRRLASMTGTPQDLADIHSALAHETASAQRVSRLKPLQTKLRSFPAEVEIVTASQVSAADLLGLANAIDQSIDLVTSHEGAFEEATLEHRLEIGLNISKAIEVFGLTRAEAGNLGGRPPETVSTVDTVSPPPSIPTGFVSWLGKYVPRLKRPTAYRYAAAYRSLGIPAAEASPARIKAKLKDLRHFAGKSNLPMPTLAALVKAAPKPPKTPLAITGPQDSKQLRLEDARESLQDWKDQWAKFVKQGQLDDLTKRDVEQLKEFQLSIGDQIKARLK